MTGRAKAAGLLAMLATAGVAAVTTAHFTSTPQPRAIGLATKSFTIQPNCQATPGKFWAGQWHFSYAILKPSVIQTACWKQNVPHGTGTVVKVSLSPVPAKPTPELAVP